MGNPQKYTETPKQKPQAIRRNTQAKHLASTVFTQQSLSSIPHRR